MMKKGSQYTRFFTQEMKKLEITGNLDLVRRRYSGSRECKLALVEKPLGYEKLSFLFVMLIFGCIMSILVILLEYMTQTNNKQQELTNKDKEVEEKVEDYLEVQGLSNQETENILGRLIVRHFTNNKEDTKLNMIRSDVFKMEIDPKNHPSKIPRLVTRKNRV